MKQTLAKRSVRVLRCIPAVFGMAAIFAASATTGEEMNTLLPFFQKLFPQMASFDWGHFVAYFMLAATIDFAIGARADRLGIKVLIVLLCGLYGITDEFHQSFVGGRMPDAADVRNDMIGAALWVILVALPPVRRLWRRIAW
ncbi:VanZ family protein [Paenibacillus algorifonticola]|uniref:VanZ family protein n=1 Tax=Paenibacillus algorifonticola TaxID=684063 RepID=UPI003D2D9622